MPILIIKSYRISTMQADNSIFSTPLSCISIAESHMYTELQTKYTIKDVFKADGDSFIFWVSLNQSKQHYIIHLSSTGNKTWLSLKPNSILFMLSPRQFILFSPKNISIDKLYFFANSWAEISIKKPHTQQALLEYEYQQFFLFTSSRLCLLVEQSKYSHRLQFSYYCCERCQILGVPFKTQNIYWDFKPYEIYKLNEHSKIGWLQYQKTAIILHSFDRQSKEKHLKIPKEVTLKGNQQYELKVIDKLWEMPKERLIVYSSGASKREDRKIYRFLLVDPKKQRGQKFIRNIPSMRQNSVRFDYNNYLFKTFGQLVIFWMDQLDRPLKSHQFARIDPQYPVFIGLKSSGVTDNKQVSSMSYKISFQVVKGQLTVSMYEQTFSIRDRYMQMLLYIDQDFDDDLLMDTIGLLTY